MNLSFLITLIIKDNKVFKFNSPSIKLIDQNYNSSLLHASSFYVILVFQ